MLGSLLRPSEKGVAVVGGVMQYLLAEFSDSVPMLPSIDAFTR